MLRMNPSPVLLLLETNARIECVMLLPDSDEENNDGEKKEEQKKQEGIITDGEKMLSY